MFIQKKKMQYIGICACLHSKRLVKLVYRGAENWNSYQTDNQTPNTNNIEILERHVECWQVWWCWLEMMVAGCVQSRLASLWGFVILLPSVGICTHPIIRNTTTTSDKKWNENKWEGTNEKKNRSVWVELGWAELSGIMRKDAIIPVKTDVFFIKF